MRNDFGLGDRAWSREGAPEVLSIPAGGKEDTFLLGSAGLAILGRANSCHFQQSQLVAFPQWRQTIAMHAFCQTGTLWPKQEPSLWKHFLIPACFCSCP